MNSEAQETILVKKDGVAVLTFNRPRVHNALNNRMVEGLDNALEDVARDDDVRVVVVTGAGEKSFLSGSDIAELSKRTPLSGVENSRRRQAVLNRLAGLGKPTIAAINGYAFGVGCEVAMACHLRIASRRARFGQLEINLGIIPGAGGTQRLPRLVGEGRALELILTGKKIDAEEALRIGLVNQVVEPESLMHECLQLANQLIQKSPVALGYALEAVRRGIETDLESGLRIEGLCLGLCLASEDSREGLTAFLDKRPPRFLGR